MSEQELPEALKQKPSIEEEARRAELGERLAQMEKALRVKLAAEQAADPQSVSFEDIARQREALAAKSGELLKHEDGYRRESARLDQLAAAARMRCDAAAELRHTEATRSSIAANNAIAANQARMEEVLDFAKRLAGDGRETIIALRELTDTIRAVSLVGVCLRLKRRLFG